MHQIWVAELVHDGESWHPKSPEYWARNTLKPLIGLPQHLALLPGLEVAAIDGYSSRGSGQARLKDFRC